MDGCNRCSVCVCVNGSLLSLRCCQSDGHYSRITRGESAFHHTWHLSHHLPVDKSVTVFLTKCTAIELISAWPFRKWRSDKAIKKGFKCLAFDLNQEALLILRFPSCECLIAAPSRSQLCCLFSVRRHLDLCFSPSNAVYVLNNTHTQLLLVLWLAESLSSHAVFY